MSLATFLQAVTLLQLAAQVAGESRVDKAAAQVIPDGVWGFFWGEWGLLAVLSLCHWLQHEAFCGAAWEG